MIRLLPYALDIVLLVFTLVDCIMADQTRVRNLPKWGWVVLIVVVPLVGSIAWLLAGRPLGARRQPPQPATRTTWERPPYERPIAPDDDPEFIARLKRTNSEHERMLKRWEEDLRRREEDLRGQSDTNETGPEPTDR